MPDQIAQLISADIVRVKIFFFGIVVIPGWIAIRKLPLYSVFLLV